ncbi:phosphoribosyl-ATP diphosphatase [Sneathiella glossodoripedis]|uniref:phosphoribosyl-ATP diphosphatase n=1 Tax=Sneathiella glossodoripedis TaxID=418853 RepID=UPI00046F3C56|nr:phosphoribosyl-ATP diphosphatase [Sneathiella glossodoripedis]
MSSQAEMLDRLYETVLARKTETSENSYTARLYAKGTKKIAQKVGEEGVELSLAAALENKAEIVSESADLLYHMCVLWANADITPDMVYAELAKREGLSGLDEKASRKEKG